MKKIMFLLVGMVLFATGVRAESYLDKKIARVGSPLPVFELKDLDGKDTRLSDYAGKVVIIHFWSANCPFVLRYENRIQEIVKQYADKGVVVLGIDANADESLEKIRKVYAERKVNYPILLDSQNIIADQFGAVTTPHIFITDTNGVLVYEGPVDDQGWSETNAPKKFYVKETLDALLAGKPAPYQKIRTFGCTVKRAR